MNYRISSTEFPTIKDIDQFDKRSGGLTERLLFNNRFLVICLCLIITAALGWQMKGLRLNAAFDKMIPINHPYILNYLENRSQLSGLGNTLRIAVENRNGDIFNVDYLETIRAINDEIFLYPGVERLYIKSLWTPAVRWNGVTEEGIDGGPVIPPSYDGSPESLNQIRLNVERSGEIGRLVAANYKSSIILVPLQGENTENQRIDYYRLSTFLEEIRSKYENENTKIYITGFAKIVGDLISGLYQVLLFFAIAVVICSIILSWHTRCLRSTALVITCSFVAIIWLLGLLPLLGYELDPYSILVPFLIFAIGISHGAQKMNGIMLDIGRGTNKLVAARYTFRRLFMAGLTALLADAVGFAVLLTINIGVIQELAITASLGVAVLIITNLVLLPILLSYTGVSPKAANHSLKRERNDLSDTEHKKHPFWDFLDAFTQKKYATIAIAIALALGIGGFTYSKQLKIGDTGAGAPELRPDARYNLDNAFMVSNYAASSDVYVVMVKTPLYHCAHYDTLLKVNALETRLAELPNVVSTNSLALLAKKASTGMNEGSIKWYSIPRSQPVLNAIITRAPRELFNRNCDFLSIYVYLKDHKADTLTSVVEAVEAHAKEFNTDDFQFLSAAGNAGIEAATNIVVKKANALMLIQVYAAVTLLAFIAFRSWRGVVCAIIPLILTSILAEALMVYLNIGIKVATLPVIALGVGIGVDYALYILTVTLTRLRQGMSLSDAYYEALLFTGKVVVLTGITLGIAVSTWAFSPIKFQADMGILLAFMFIWNMLGAMILLPALAAFLLKPTPKNSTE